MFKFVGVIILALTSQLAVAKSEFSYFIDGQATKGWRLTLGDKQKWNLGVKNNTGQSLQNQVSMKPADYHGQPHAIRLSWAAKGGDGAFAITGRPMDLSKVKGHESNIALTFDVFIHTRPRGDVKLGMYCDYPCRGQISLTPLLRSLPSEKWHSVPIPLSCFTDKGLDLSKITSPFALQTGSRMEISIANIRITRLGPDNSGC